MYFSNDTRCVTFSPFKACQCHLENVLKPSMLKHPDKYCVMMCIQAACKLLCATENTHLIITKTEDLSFQESVCNTENSSRACGSAVAS